MKRCDWKLICLRLFVLLVIGLAFTDQLRAQTRPNYTVLQAGGIVGVKSSDGNPLSGYQFQFVFGRNFNDRSFLGLGIGNDVYRGEAEITNGNTSLRRLSTFPLFADFRQIITPVSIVSNLGLVANGGYALPLGGDYYRGFMGKAGLTYSHLLADRSDIQFALAYGFQQFRSNFIHRGFHQQQILLTVGFFIY